MTDSIRDLSTMYPWLPATYNTYRQLWGDEPTDCVNEILYGLAKGEASYTNEHGANRRTWLGIKVVSAIKTYAQECKREACRMDQLRRGIHGLRPELHAKTRHDEERRIMRLDVQRIPWHVVAPEQKRRLLLWAQGYTYQDIASKEGISMEGVEVSLRRALRTLQKTMSPTAGGGEG